MNLPKETTTTKQPAQAGAAAAVAKTPVLSKDLNVVADKATNTLKITADRDDYRMIEGVIQKLDAPRPMVYIEALIMECRSPELQHRGRVARSEGHRQRRTQWTGFERDWPRPRRLHGFKAYSPRSTRRGSREHAGRLLPG